MLVTIVAEDRSPQNSRMSASRYLARSLRVLSSLSWAFHVVSRPKSSNAVFRVASGHKRAGETRTVHPCTRYLTTFNSSIEPNADWFVLSDSYQSMRIANARTVIENQLPFEAGRQAFSFIIDSLI
jgi:hypothetical protein